AADACRGYRDVRGELARASTGRTVHLPRPCRCAINGSPGPRRTLAGWTTHDEEPFHETARPARLVGRRRPGTRTPRTRPIARDRSRHVPGHVARRRPGRGSHGAARARVRAR